MTSTSTLYILGAVILLVLAWDVYLEIKKGNDWTISYTLMRAAFKYPLLPLLCGIILGHLFWGNSAVCH